MRRIAQVLLGLYWSVCGALMALNPPPPGFRRSQALPWVGWMVLAVSLYIAVKAVTDRDPSRVPSGRPPRHARGEDESGRDTVLLAGAGVLGALAGVWAVWWGYSNGYLSMVGLGLAMLPLVLAAIPYIVALVRRLT